MGILITGTDEVAPDDGCLFCGQPKSGHGVRWHNVAGDHTWIKPDRGTQRLRWKARKEEG